MYELVVMVGWEELLLLLLLARHEGGGGSGPRMVKGEGISPFIVSGSRPIEKPLVINAR